MFMSRLTESCASDSLLTFFVTKFSSVSIPVRQLQKEIKYKVKQQVCKSCFFVFIVTLHTIYNGSVSTVVIVRYCGVCCSGS